MSSRYNAALAAILAGRKVTKDMITGDPADRYTVFESELPPMQDEWNQAEIDAEQAEFLRAGIEERRKRMKGK